VEYTPGAGTYRASAPRCRRRHRRDSRGADGGTVATPAVPTAAPSALPHNVAVEVSARLEYGLRAVLELAQQQRSDPASRLTAEHIARTQGIPVKFLESILGLLRQRGLIASQRGPAGGYWLVVDPDQLQLADVVRALEGPLAGVRGQPPEDVHYTGAAGHLPEVWVALRGAMRLVLEGLTVGDVLAGRFPEPIADLLAQPGARRRR